MTGGKKWLLILTNEQYTWIRETAAEVGLKGSDIVREIIGRVMEEDSKKFRASLAQAQLKIKLQSYNDKIAALEEEKQEIKKKLGSTRETVNV